MPHRTALGRTGSARLGAAGMACAALAALVFHAPQLHAETGAEPTHAAELAAGACRLGRWAAAVDLLRVADRQKLRAQDWLCLARAQLHTGQWVAALDSYDELVEADATPGKERDTQQLGAAERQDLEARLAWIRIQPSAPLPPSVQLSLDGETIARNRWGAEFPVQPGTHSLSVQVHGEVQELEHWRLAEGERRSVHLTLPADPGSLDARQASAAQRAVAPHTVAQRQPPPPSSMARWGNGALYAGGIGSVGGFFVMMGANGPAMFKAGVGGMVLGGLSLMTGAALHLIDAAPPSATEAPVEAPKRLRVQPWISTHAAGVSGSF